MGASHRVTGSNEMVIDVHVQHCTARPAAGVRKALMVTSITISVRVNPTFDECDIDYVKAGLIFHALFRLLFF
jgi:hypothetical protein